MNGTGCWLGIAAAALGVLSGCRDETPSARGAAPSASAPAAPPSETPLARESPTSSERARTTASPGQSASAGDGQSPAGKTYACGGRSQRPCPMQGWMKKVMAPASMDGDREALANALTYAAEHAPPGYPDWATLARTGASRARAGDLEGAQASCQPCHDAYKERYKATMRDAPW